MTNPHDQILHNLPCTPLHAQSAATPVSCALDSIHSGHKAGSPAAVIITGGITGTITDGIAVMTGQLSDSDESAGWVKDMGVEEAEAPTYPLLPLRHSRGRIDSPDCGARGLLPPDEVCLLGLLFLLNILARPGFLHCTEILSTQDAVLNCVQKCVFAWGCVNVVVGVGMGTELPDRLAWYAIFGRRYF